MSAKKGDRVRITTPISRFKEQEGTVESSGDSFAYIRLDAHPEASYTFMNDEFTAVSSDKPRVQDAPSEEVQIKTLTKRVEELETENRSLAKSLATSENAVQRLTAITEATAYPYRLQVGASGDVKVTYYTSEREGMDALRNARGYRTLEKREGDLWKFAGRYWA